jgi:hypothetical protein
MMIMINNKSAFEFLKVSLNDSKVNGLTLNFIVSKTAIKDILIIIGKFD